jgi:hypothetical protein
MRTLAGVAARYSRGFCSRHDRDRTVSTTSSSSTDLESVHMRELADEG